MLPGFTGEGICEGWSESRSTTYGHRGHPVGFGQLHRDGEIAAITGHGLRAVDPQHQYLHRDVELAGAAIHKPEMGLFDTRHGGRNRNKSVKMSCQKGLIVLTQKKKKAV